MSDPTSLVALASTGLVAAGMASAAALKGWNEWLDLRRTELTSGRRRGGPADLVELKQRVRRLEAIADGSGE